MIRDHFKSGTAFMPRDTASPIPVVPAKAGTQRRSPQSHWIPAYAGMTKYIAGMTSSEEQK